MLPRGRDTTSKVFLIGLMAIATAMLFLPDVRADFLSIGYNGSSQDYGNFNPLLVSTSSDVISATSVKTIPLYGDMDNDGNVELVVFDSTQMEIYQNRTLDTVENVIYTNITEVKNTILIDIDGDSYIEAVVYGDPMTINVFEYNGTHLYLEYYQNINGCGSGYQADSMMGCKENNAGCLLVINDRDTSTTAIGGVSRCMVNVTSPTGNGYIARDITMTGFTYNGGDWACALIPAIPYISVGTGGEWVFTLGHISKSVGAGNYVANVRIERYENNQTHLTKIEHGSLAVTEMPEPNFGGYSCAQWSVYFTSPLVMDLDGSIGNGQEIAVGSMSSDNDFIITTYDKELNYLKRSPDASDVALLLQDDGEGEIVSNIITGNFIPGNDGVDYCLFGFHRTQQHLDLLCTTLDNPSGLINDDQGLGIDISDLGLTSTFNITRYPTSPNYKAIAHSAEHYHQLDGFTGNLENLDELVCPYGIFYLDYSSTSTDDLRVSWLNDIGQETTLLSYDLNNNGYADLIRASSSNVWYIDDDFVNSPAYISDLSYIQPAVDAPWLTNTTAFITVQVIDPDGDQVRARASIYEGLTFEQNYTFTAYTLSDSYFTFEFTANRTVSNGIIRVEANDIENPDEIASVDIYFTVSNNGLRYYGDGSETYFGTSPSADDETSGITGAECNGNADCASGFFCSIDGTCKEKLDDEDNNVARGAHDLSNITGIPIVIMLLFIAVAFIWTSFKVDMPGYARIVIILFSPLIIFGAGAIMGIISVFWVIITVLLIVLGAGLSFAFILRGG